MNCPVGKSAGTAGARAVVETLNPNLIVTLAKVPGVTLTLPAASDTTGAVQKALDGTVNKGTGAKVIVIGKGTSAVTPVIGGVFKMYVAGLFPIPNNGFAVTPVTLVLIVKLTQKKYVGHT